MKNLKLAFRYANALYDFSLETGNVENVYHDILQIQEVITTHKELKPILESPIIPKDKKQNIVKEIFQKNISNATFQFFTLIIKKNRTPQLLMICRQFIKIYYRNHNIKEAFVTSAQQLSEKKIQYLKASLEKNSPYTFILHFSVDPRIIGGLIVRVDDYYYDASIQTKINKLKAEFSQNAYAVGF